jgi:hypothetical protein
MFRFAPVDHVARIARGQPTVNSKHRHDKCPRAKRLAGATNMGYNVSFQVFDDYLRVDVSGMAKPGNETHDSREIWCQVADSCRAEMLSRILTVWNVPGRLPTMAAYEIASDLEAVHWEPRFRVAVVQLNEERYRDSLFAETVAVNRGYQAKVFRSENEAVSRLLEVPIAAA